MGNTAWSSEATPDGASEPGGSGGVVGRTTEPAEPPPATWYTEEMVEAAAKGIHQTDMLDTWDDEGCNDTLNGEHESCKSIYLEKARAALDAIAPMVLDLLDEEYAKGYSDAYWNEDDKGVTE